VFGSEGDDGIDRGVDAPDVCEVGFENLASRELPYTEKAGKFDGAEAAELGH
jgi:hypothetical protein